MSGIPFEPSEQFPGIGSFDELNAKRFEDRVIGHVLKALGMETAIAELRRRSKAEHNDRFLRTEFLNVAVDDLPYEFHVVTLVENKDDPTQWNFARVLATFSHAPVVEEFIERSQARLSERPLAMFAPWTTQPGGLCVYGGPALRTQTCWQLVGRSAEHQLDINCLPSVIFFKELSALGWRPSASC
jgi:hypothetical protein